MRILAIDQASTSGWALITTPVDVDPSACNYSGCEVVSGVFKASGTQGERFIAFREWLENSIESYKPDIVIHERPHLRGYDASLMALGFVTTIMEVCTRCNVIMMPPVFTVSLKKFATDYGKADKDAMLAAASQMAGRAITDDNEADAVLIGIYALSEYGSFKTRMEAEAAKKTRKKKR